MAMIIQDVVYQEHYRSRIAAAVQAQVEDALKQFAGKLIETYPPGSRERDTIVAAVVNAAEDCSESTAGSGVLGPLRLV